MTDSTDNAPKRAEVFAAMMDSLICSFQMADDTASRPIFSFNYGDVAEVLDFYRAIARADLAPTQPDPRVTALIAATKGFVTASYRGTAHTHLVEAREGVLAALAAFDTTGGKADE